ncbi:FAD-linked oxidase C-terminal domain-containing protein [Nocardia vulneris]|uniref:Fad linked oxidase domain-containing protein n=1 Tax=Nocardia brasiliensis (strain ATCC 700358 / HUJEG-1) TaxID=1133849 RepID=K0ES93_NOCB7|nr:FAD-linked oxidase C-terminal domain-containing protein [Nocardia brasiliensis]AFU02683.1 fad linked oxidase domain-containing protein [Nocardia brasiliensis ATCC 700358]OCF85638.1 FAD-linked oxidase [Nocardia brasiliensis]
MNPAVAALQAVLPDAVVVTDPEVLERHARDRSRFTSSARPLAVVRPTVREQVQQTMRVATQQRIPVVPQGLRTGVAGGANGVAGCIALDMTAMNQIREIDIVSRIVVVEPGVVEADISAAVEPHRLCYPPNPSWLPTATIGGNVANGGGTCSVKYGVTSLYVLGLEVVLANGELLRCGRRTAKGVAGYDVTQLLVGSEGTLGVITEITLALHPVATPLATLTAAFGTLHAAGRAIESITESGCIPSVLELLDRVHLRAIEALAPSGLPDAAALLFAQCATGAKSSEDLHEMAELCRAAHATEINLAFDPIEGEKLMAARQLANRAMDRLGTVLIGDVVVPRSHLAAMFEDIDRIAAENSIVIGLVAHGGDGNLHPMIVVDRDDPVVWKRARTADEAIVAKALAFGGTCTGEHGIGLTKREWLAREIGPTGMRLQHAVKAAFDPLGILNPGKVL